MELKFLEDIGLTKSEAQIYITILDLGSSLAGNISQKSGIHRRSVYDAIERLIEKGLVSYITRNNRKYFEAVNPERLIQISEERTANIKSILPELTSRFGLAQNKEDTVFYKGKLALKNVFDDQISEGKTIYVVGGSIEAKEIIRFYFNHYDVKREEKNIPIKMIFPKGAKGTDIVKQIPLSEIRYIDDKYISPVATNVYGDKVAIIVWSEEPIAILIKNKTVSDAYKKNFNFLWERADA